MCEKHSSSAKNESATKSSSAGSRRRRLWDLSRDTHCPIIGVCIPLAVLRRLICKALGGNMQADDYEISCWCNR